MASKNYITAFGAAKGLFAVTMGLNHNLIGQLYKEILSQLSGYDEPNK
jgi:hypothetical protein